MTRAAHSRPAARPAHHHGNGKKVTEGITMRIKARMGISLDGYVAATDGPPSLIKAGG
jgi:hypothetical protein